MGVNELRERHEAFKAQQAAAQENNGTPAQPLNRLGRAAKVREVMSRLGPEATHLQVNEALDAFGIDLSASMFYNNRLRLFGKGHKAKAATAEPAAASSPPKPRRALAMPTPPKEKPAPVVTAPPPVAGGPSRIRAVFVEAELGNGADLSGIMGAITEALRSKS